MDDTYKAAFYYEHIPNKKGDGKILSKVVCILVCEDGKVTKGVAKTNLKLDVPNKKLGRVIAFGRAWKDMIFDKPGAYYEAMTGKDDLVMKYARPVVVRTGRNGDRVIEVITAEGSENSEG